MLNNYMNTASTTNVLEIQNIVKKYLIGTEFVEFILAGVEY